MHAAMLIPITSIIQAGTAAVTIAAFAVRITGSAHGVFSLPGSVQQRSRRHRMHGCS